MATKLAEITAQRITHLRRERKLTQSQLAEQIGVSRSCIANWERCIREPNAADVCALASCFCVSTEYLFGRTDTYDKVNIPKAYDINFENLNSLGKKMFMDYYNFLMQDESFTKKS